MDLASFETLLDRYLTGEATADELARFEGELRGDADKRRRLAERCLFEVELRKALAGRLPAEPRSLIAAPRSHVALYVTLATMAAGLLLAVLTYLAWPSRHGVEIVSGTVQIDGKNTDRIPAGVVFAVDEQKPAVVQLPDTSRVELDASSKAALRERVGDARQVVELQEGGGVFEVADRVGEFRVETPAGNVTALGTVFSIKLRPRPPSPHARGTHTLTVAVTSGRVRVDADGQSVILGAKTSRTFGDDGQQNNIDDGQKNNQGNQGNKQNKN